MPKKPGKTGRRAPFAWVPLLHFANARLTEANWQAVLLKAYGVKPMPGWASSASRRWSRWNRSWRISGETIRRHLGGSPSGKSMLLA